MRKIAIVGAGQSGFLLAFSLIKRGYQVTLYSDKTGDELFEAPITGATYLFGDAIDLEKELEINLWEHSAYHSTAFNINFGTPEGEYAFSIRSHTEKAGAAIDQRLKFFHWAELLQRRGGKFIVSRISPGDLPGLTAQFDLVVIASGRTSLKAIFKRDNEKSSHFSPARKLIQLYIHDLNITPTSRFTSINLDAVMGQGEFITSPFYHKDGIQGAFLLLEIVPVGVFDVFGEEHSASSILNQIKSLIKKYMPWKYDFFEDLQVINEEAYLIGEITPEVRIPYARLDGEHAVLGIGDAVILNDPIVGQGGNNASKMADAYAKAIAERSTLPFDTAWMTKTFNDFWKYSKYVNRFSDLFLAPPPPHIVDILQAAIRNPAIASAFVNGFNHPPSLFPWIDDVNAAQIYLERQRVRS